MLGLDKKSLRKLEQLQRCDALSEAHISITASLAAWYRNPEFRFFTSGQRRMIDDMHNIYIKPLSRREELKLDAIKAAAEDAFATDREKELCLSILGQGGSNPRAWSPKQRKLLDDILDRLKERRRQKIVRDQLELACDNGEVRPGSESFCRSIIASFDERHQWTEVQMEHAEKILNNNEDPEDDEDEDSQD